MDKRGSVLGHWGGLGGAQSLLPQPMAPGEPGVGGFPRLRAQRCLAIMPELRRAAPPRVCAPVWRTWWNGWVTGRRMQLAPGVRRSCVFGCTALGAEDSIEHYASCQHVAAFAARALQLPRLETPQLRLASFLLLDVAAPMAQRDVLVRQALRAAAVYRTHCLVLHGSVP